VRSLTKNTQWFLSIGIASTIVLTSCSDATDRGAADRTSDTAEALFRKLEQRLLSAESVHIRGAAGSAGAVISGLEGEVVLASGNRARIQFSGEFGGMGVTLALVADGEQMWGGNGTDQFEDEAPTSLNEGILLGFTRMGILHNLALLSSVSSPDGTDGTIRDWVTVSNFAWGESGTLDGVAAEALTFDLTVNGTPAAKVVLWLDQENGLPVQREQLVQFPDGEMRAIEVYEAVEIDAPFESEKFVIP
jgi:outer membrane lipoprotein-sorting protein